MRCTGEMRVSSTLVDTVAQACCRTYQQEQCCQMVERRMESEIVLSHRLIGIVGRKYGIWEYVMKRKEGKNEWPIGQCKMNNACLSKDLLLVMVMSAARAV